MRPRLPQTLSIGFISVALFVQTAFAQQKPGSLDASFDAGSLYSEVDYLVPDGKVIGLALGPKEEIYIGGHFTGFGRRFGEKPWNGIARLYQDGTLDETFAVPIFDQSLMNHIDAHDIFVQTNGTVWAGFGSFEWRFRIDGSVDPLAAERYNSVSIPVGSVYPDGRFLGPGTDPENWDVWNVPRFLPDGKLDPNFQPLFGAQSDPRLVLRNGKILSPEVSGYNYSNFEYSGYLERRNEDGTLDSTFQPINFGAEGVEGIRLLLERPNGQVYAIGEFAEVNLEPWPKLVRFNPDGTIDPSFRPDPRMTQSGTNTPLVLAATLQKNGKLLLGGVFWRSEPSLRAGIVRLNLDGSIDTNFDPGAGISEGNDGPIFPPKIWNMAVQGDGKILIVGDFLKFDGTSRDGVARLFGDPVVPLNIQNVIRSPEAPLKFDVTGTAEIVEIEVSENLKGEWSSAATLNMTNGFATYVEPQQPIALSRFYRVRVR